MASVVDKSVFDSGGRTTLAMAQDNVHLCIASKKGIVKVMNTERVQDEPRVLEVAKDLTSITFGAKDDSTLLVTSKNGDAFLYDARDENTQGRLLARSVLPIRDCKLIHSDKQAVFGGDDLQLTIVNLADGTKNHLKIEEQVSSLSYGDQSNTLAVSLVNGKVQFFSVSSAVPNKVHELNDYIPKQSFKDAGDDALLSNVLGSDNDDDDDDDDDTQEERIKDPEFCDDNRICTNVAWHPKGMHFALPNKDKTISVFNIKDYSLQKSLTTSGSNKLFCDVQFDPRDGNYIAAVDLNNHLTVWDWKKSEVKFSRKLRQNVTNMVWSIQEESNCFDLIVGTWNGAILTVKSIVEFANPADYEIESGAKNNKGLNLFVDDEAESDDDENKANGTEDQNEEIDDENLFTEDENDDTKKRKYHFDDEEDFIDDDDGAGYVSAKKHQPQEYAVSNPYYSVTSDRKIQSKPYKYRPFSAGATPFANSDRRYLTMNEIGYVSTVKNNSQYSVTVSFFDVGRFREYHFEDLFGYDVAFLNENGTLFAQSKLGQINYRPHTSLYSNWTKTIPLQQGERITTIAATPKMVYVGTSFGYFRVFNEYGVPLTVEKMVPIVALTAQDYKVFTVHFSPLHGLSYSLFEITTDSSRYFQRESPLPIELPNQQSRKCDRDFIANNPLGIKSLFFSSYGDPCIFGIDDVLLVLSKWRSGAQCRWIPILDSNFEVWRMSGGKDHSDVHVWPLSFSYDTLNCILVKGKHIWPDFPLPLPSEMQVQIPVLVKSQLMSEHNKERKERAEAGIEDDEDDAEDGAEKEVQIPQNFAAEEEYLRSKILSELLQDTIENDGEMYGNENKIIASLIGIHDKSLLRLFAIACSDQNPERALSIAQELKQDKALTAAVKVSERAEMVSLVKKINDIREARYNQQMDNL
ncbi:hypothetical protein RNJ44_02898 [Nakaseomyces bracarensis]|uniref:Minichromosome loss protein Mcl1 middle region domain-containing protein n=1 Tax=Nakaseomyces bracarensis TaxID=273131 RepID=A0ABR4P0N1_9SACH